MLVSTGATQFGREYKQYPWTIGWQPDYVSEARIYGLDIKKNHPNAKIAILYQNDSYGKDYLNGFKAALGSAKVKSQVVGGDPYEVTGGPPSSQLDPATRVRCGHADDLRDDVGDDHDLRDHPPAQLEAGEHLRQLRVGDGHVHG